MSAILPVHNEAPVLREVLESVERQTRRPDELVLVFDRCSDESEDVAKGRGDRVLVVDYGNTGAAVQAGVEGAAHPILVLLDGNTVVPKDFVQLLVAAWERTRANVVEWHGGLMLLPRSTLDRFGPFSTRALWTLEYFLRVKSYGGTVHPLHGSFTRLKPSPLRRNLAYGLDFADLSDKHGLPPFFRIGNKSGVVPDTIAAFGSILGHARHGDLLSSLRRLPSELSRSPRLFGGIE